MTIWDRHPPVGVFIAILALLGVLVPLLREHVDKREKALWTLVMLALLGLELRSISLDHTEQIETRKKEDEHFSKIADGVKETADGVKATADGIQTTITDNQKSFATTMRQMEGLSQVSKEGVDQITGGDAFPEALISVYPEVSGDTRPGLPILVANQSKKYPLYELSFSVIPESTMSLPDGRSSVGFDFSHPHFAGSLGTLDPYDLRWVDFRASRPTSEEKDVQYGFYFKARNGSWTEWIQLRRRGNRLTSAMQIYSNATFGKPGRILRTTDFDK